MALKRRHYIILQTLLKHPCGLTRDEIIDIIHSDGEANYNRKTFVKDLRLIREQTDINISSRDDGKNIWHYSISLGTSDQCNRTKVAGILIANLLESQFLREFRDLGDRIQPIVIPHGHEYLHIIGTALRAHRILACTYQKFTDTEPYDCLLMPYVLKVDKGRWYLFAHKDENQHAESLQCFALDRTLRLEITPETFVPDSRIDLDEYFRDCFGVWHDYESYPVRDIAISCTEKAAHYLRTLPLHHSQRESTFMEEKEDRIIFTYHISPSPDFIGELAKWGDEVRIKEDKWK